MSRPDDDLFSNRPKRDLKLILPVSSVEFQALKKIAGKEDNNFTDVMRKSLRDYIYRNGYQNLVI